MLCIIAQNREIFYISSQITYTYFAVKLQVCLFDLKTTQKFGKKVEKIEYKTLWF